MKSYSAGSITLTTGSNVIRGEGTSFLANVRTGSFLTTLGVLGVYQVAKVVSDTELLLSQPAEGRSENSVSGLAYSIGDEFTGGLALPMPGRHDLDPNELVARSLDILDDLIPV